MIDAEGVIRIDDAANAALLERFEDDDGRLDGSEPVRARCAELEVEDEEVE